MGKRLLANPACSPAFYLNVTNAVEPHPRLVFSIKHTALDFWRRVALNPTLGIGQHRQVVEAGAPGSCACFLFASGTRIPAPAEINGMYAGCGSWPLYSERSGRRTNTARAEACVTPSPVRCSRQPAHQRLH